MSRPSIKIPKIELMKKLFPFFLFLVFLAIYYFSSGGNTPYDYFTRLANAFTSRRYYITENPSWLSELIPAGGNRFYIPYPPGPALSLIPFVIFFGKSFPQQYIAHLMGAGIVVFSYLLAKKISGKRDVSLWTALFTGLSTIIWYMSSVGSSWYLGQISACFFLIWAVYESQSKKRPFLIGLLVGMAYLSRVHTLLSLPFFLFILFGQLKTIKGFLLFLIPLGVCLIFNSFYNFIRYGVIWDKSYLLIPGVLEEPWFQKGIISPIYIKENLKTAFWTFPKRLATFPYLQPSWYGLAIWITSPGFIFAFTAKVKERVVQFAWFVVFLIFLFVAMHGTTGFAQFGYRFAVDFYAFLILLTIKGVSRTGLKWYHWLLLFIGIVVNLWGVLWINKFDWVSF